MNETRKRAGTALLTRVVTSLFLTLAVGGVAWGEIPEVAGSRLEPSAELIVDAIRLASGGEAVDNAFMGKMTLALDFDGAAATRLKGTRARFNVIATSGDSLSSLTGDLQVASNIEAPEDLRVFEAWVERDLGAHASVLAGYRDFNAEFDVATIAAGLLNSSFGVGPDVSQVGPSVFPRSYPGVRVRVSGDSGAYALAGAWRGVPYPIADPVSGNDVEGTFSAIELGWTRESFGRLGSPKLTAGWWRFEASGDRIPEGDEAVGGFYALAEAEVVLGGGRRIGGFLRAGRTLDDSITVRDYVGGGMRLASISRVRPDDEVAVGIARARLSPASRAHLESGAETTVELNWTIQLTGYLAIVPDVQFVASPAASATARDAFLFGVRTVITWK